MHPILTQGLLPTKNAPQQSGPNTEPETLPSGSDRKHSETESRHSFSAIFENAHGISSAENEEPAIVVDVHSEETQETGAANNKAPENEEDITPAAQEKPRLVVDKDSTISPADPAKGSTEKLGQALHAQEINADQEPVRLASEPVLMFGSRRALQQDVTYATPRIQVNVPANGITEETPPAGTDRAALKPAHAGLDTQEIPTQTELTRTNPSTGGKPELSPSGTTERFALMPPSKQADSAQSQQQNRLTARAVPTSLQTAEVPDQVRTNISNLAPAHNIGAKIEQPLVPPAVAAPMLPAGDAPRRTARSRTNASDVTALDISTSKTVRPTTGQRSGIAITPLQPAIFAPLETSKILTSSFDTEPILGSRSDLIQTASTVQSQVVHTNAPLQQHVARQIAEALQHLPNRPVEITLNPEELGRVRLAVSTSEAGIVVNVLAERQETVELMRRHIASLETAFQDIGYSDIAFSFSGGDQTQEDNNNDTSQNGASDNVALDDLPLKPNQINLTTGLQAGLDIRL